MPRANIWRGRRRMISSKLSLTGRGCCWRGRPPLKTTICAHAPVLRMRVSRWKWPEKLAALGLSEQQIGALPQQPGDSLPRQEIRAPIKGRVVERKVDLGTAVGRDNLETEL